MAIAISITERMPINRLLKNLPVIRKLTIETIKNKTNIFLFNEVDELSVTNIYSMFFVVI